MKYKLHFLIAIICLPPANSLNAALIECSYVGNTFTSVLFGDFTTSDSIIGTATIDNSNVLSNTVSFTVSGTPGFTISDSNITGFVFDGTGQQLTDWNALINSNVTGSSDPDEIQVTSTTGDAAAVDIVGASFAHFADVGTPGTWTCAPSVPEPSAFHLLSCLVITTLTIRRLTSTIRRQPC